MWTMLEETSMETEKGQSLGDGQGHCWPFFWRWGWWEFECCWWRAFHVGLDLNKGVTLRIITITMQSVIVTAIGLNDPGRRRRDNHLQEDRLNMT
jgi:hypothetical protein